MARVISIPEGYGRVSALALGVIPLFAWVQGLTVTVMRGKAGIKYPNAYATKQEAKESQLAYQFNCAQRAHAQYLENMSQTIAMLMFAGLWYPRETTWLGGAWVALRVVYWVGYVFSGKPDGKGRLFGVFFWFAQGSLWGFCAWVSRKLW